MIVMLNYIEVELTDPNEGDVTKYIKYYSHIRNIRKVVITEYNFF